ncbi:hypothetical protein EG329_014099 [Mollisiaceae sp. DMI_Dod_QoI]|nr:hypothetical protein EG329_014099 [Helotiales sp. DMI_Dod_QoI]
MDVENSLRTLQGLDMMQHDLLTIILPYVEAEDRTSVELYIRTVMMKSIENTLNLAFASAGWEKIGNDDEDGEFYAPTGVLTSLSDWGFKSAKDEDETISPMLQRRSMIPTTKRSSFYHHDWKFWKGKNQKSFGHLAAATLVPPLQHRQPTKVESFKYNSLIANSNEIRLLQINPRPRFPKSYSFEEQGNRSLSSASNPEVDDIHLEIFPANLDENIPFKALSYTWGIPSDPHHTIYLNRYPFQVRQNLWLALERFRRLGETLVMWIDAICIDQSNELERNHQVSRMKEIYEKADEVLVWLGPSFGHSHRAFRLVRKLYECRDDDERILDRFSRPSTKPGLEALADLFDREYWKRIWIIQEITVARRITLFCGDDFVNAQHLLIAQQLLKSMETRYPADGDVLLKYFPSDAWVRVTLEFEGLVHINEWKASLASTTPSFFECFLYHFNQNCSDPRDMIYGLAALANEKSLYKVPIDYSLSVTRVFTDFAKLEIASSNRVNILTRVCSNPTSYGLPSWVPNLAMGRTGHRFLRDITDPEYTFSAAKDTAAVIAFDTREDVLTFEGLAVGCLNIVGPSTNMKGSEDTDALLQGFFRWWSLLSKMEGDQELNHEAFARTLIWARGRKYCKSSQEFSKLHQDVLGAYGDFLTEVYPELPADMVLMRYWNAYIAKERLQMPNGSFNEQEYRDIMRTWIMRENFWDRLFFISGNKTMGFAPAEAREGDIICVPLGCWHPLILRKVDDHYINLGEAYVDGYMDGKAIDMWENGELSLQKFEIH